MTIAASGAQWSIEHGDDRLTVAQVGGGLRQWSRGGRETVAGYALSEMCTSGRGQHLIPWPNRIRDGAYTFGETAYQLRITEVALGNASHGLVRWSPWHLIERDDATLTVGHRLSPQPGWDWHLDSRVTYAVTPAGLNVTVGVTNVGQAAAPFGYGAHPYVATGDAAVADVGLTVPAERVVLVDNRQLPTGVVPVEGSGWDFRRGRTIGTQRVDTAYTDLHADSGRWAVTVSTPHGTHAGEVEVWGDADAFSWVQVFSGKAEANQTGAHGIAVEPMTCPPDAFNSGTDLIVLEPGQTWTGQWGISPR